MDHSNGASRSTRSAIGITPTIRRPKLLALRGLRLAAMVFALLGMTRSTGTESIAGGVNANPRRAILPSPVVERLAAQEDPGERAFRQNCAPCHGPTGHGDGPAAVAFNPRPADFRDPDGIAELTDEQVVEVITKGRNAMPAFGPVLGDSVLVPLVAYVRKLSRGDGG